MDGNLIDELKRAYKQVRMISIALIVGLFVYVIVVEVIKRKMAPFEGFSPFSNDYILRYALFACSIVMFLAIKIIKSRMLSRESRGLSSPSSSQPPSPSQTSSLFASTSPGLPSPTTSSSPSSSLFASKSTPSQTSSPQRKSLFSPPVQKLVTASIISLALSEAVAIYGLVIFLINGSSIDFYFFLTLSFIFIIIHFPRYSQWEDWIKKIDLNR